MIVDPEFEADCATKPLTELRVMQGQKKIYNRQKLEIIDAWIIRREAEEKAALDELNQRNASASERQASASEGQVTVAKRANLFSAVALGISVISAAVATWSAITTHNATMGQMRAYLFVEPERGIKLASANGSTIEIQIQYRNYGQTPALNVSNNAWVKLDSWPPRTTDWTGPPDPEGVKTTSLAQGSSLYIRTGSSRPLSTDETAKVARGELRLYVYGVLTYDDTFGNPHRTEFCFASTPGNAAYRSSWARCPQHNSQT